jgi:ABC-2 type transport system permease protein
MRFDGFYYVFVNNTGLYLLHIPIAFRFGSSISVLLGLSGTILAGYFENAIGDKIWPIIPWEWGVRFLENYFDISSTPVFPGIIALIMMTAIVLILSLFWFSRWEGNVIQE